MAVSSIVKVSELEDTKRLDAEYYRPAYVRLARRLSKHTTVPLGAIAQVTDGIHASPVFQAASGIRYISAKCVRDCYFNLSTVEEISSAQHRANPRTALRTNDVIVSTVGTVGFCAVVDEDMLPANCDRHVGIVRIRETSRFDPHFVAAFMNTKYGRNQTIREATGNVQLNLFIYAIAKVRVPFFDGHQRIGDVLRKGLWHFKQSEVLYLQAERMVLAEIGWDKLDLFQPKSYTVPLARGREVHRLDAEHFQPKYDKLVTHLNKTGAAKPLGEIAAYIKRGLQPRYVEDGEILVVNSQHLGRYLLNVEATERTDWSFWQENKKARLRKNDVLLYSTGAYIGRTNAWLEDRKGIASNHVTIIRPGEACDPPYLSVFLNSTAGLAQAEKWASGSGQREIYPEDIARFLIYLPSGKFQGQVVDLVQQSYIARQKAKALLEEAKRRIEAMIEGRT